MIADSNASNVYITWNLFLDKELAFLRRFPSRKQVQKHLPQSMKTKNGKPKEIMRDVRVIIDCVEFRCETSLPVCQLPKSNFIVLIIMITLINYSLDAHLMATSPFRQPSGQEVFLTITL